MEQTLGEQIKEMLQPDDDTISGRMMALYLYRHYFKNVIDERSNLVKVISMMYAAIPLTKFLLKDEEYLCFENYLYMALQFMPSMMLFMANL
jgi:hypothetical protein